MSRLTRRAERIARQRAERRVRDLTMMQTPSKWPYWPMLPTKRPIRSDGLGWPECAVLLCVAGYYPEDGTTTTIKVIDGSPFVGLSSPLKVLCEYPSWEALLDDGWTVN